MSDLFNNNKNNHELNTVNKGAVSVESEREIESVRGRLYLAKTYPRDLKKVREDVLSSCKLVSMASVAFYTLPRGDKSVTGSSIRLAEEIARCCGNIEYGHIELSRSSTKSEVKVYAWDLQSNVMSSRQMTVEHVIDLAGGKFRPTKSQKEIDDLISNKASKSLRGRLLAVLPRHIVEESEEQCRLTLTECKTPISAREIEAMVQAFSKFGAKKADLEKFLGCSVEKMTRSQYAEMIGIGNALKEGMDSVENIFGIGNKEIAEKQDVAIDLKEAFKKKDVPVQSEVKVDKLAVEDGTTKPAPKDAIKNTEIVRPEVKPVEVFDDSTVPKNDLANIKDEQKKETDDDFLEFF